MFMDRYLIYEYSLATAKINMTKTDQLTVFQRNMKKRVLAISITGVLRETPLSYCRDFKPVDYPTLIAAYTNVHLPVVKKFVKESILKFVFNKIKKHRDKRKNTYNLFLVSLQNKNLYSDVLYHIHSFL